jgi:hypothetical protein
MGPTICRLCKLQDADGFYADGSGLCSACISKHHMLLDYCDGCHSLWPRLAIRQVEGEYTCPPCRLRAAKDEHIAAETALAQYQRTPDVVLV